MDSAYQKKLRKKISQHLSSNKIGYLLGAGSSYLNGAGYPLMFELWGKIKNNVKDPERGEIQDKMDSFNIGLEAALDELDTGKFEKNPHRILVAEAIAQYFVKVRAPLDIHKAFLRNIVMQRDEIIKIFSLNYDPLIERAAEKEQLHIVDGFIGHESAYFDPDIFDTVLKTPIVSGGRKINRPVGHIVHLIKLHGSLGWHVSNEDGVIRRANFDWLNQNGSKRFMIPPQYRKAQETVAPPYSKLWSIFHKIFVQGPNTLNRAAVIGYGMADEHVNIILEAACRNRNFSLLIFSKSLDDYVFTKWSKKSNVLIVTGNRSSLYGEVGEGLPTLATFESLVSEFQHGKVG